MRYIFRSVVVLALAATAGCAGDVAPAGTVGAAAPEFTARTLEGDTVGLADIGGEAVLLNIWATWCPPCREEVPELQALHEEFEDRGLRVVGVSIDASGADRAVREFVDEFDVTYRILRDPNENVASAFRAPGVPMTALIDDDGTILWRHVGLVHTDDPELRKLLEQALQAPAG